MKERCFCIPAAPQKTGNGGASGSGSGAWSHGEPRNGIAETETERRRKPEGRFEDGGSGAASERCKLDVKDNGDSRNTVVACRSTARGYACLYTRPTSTRNHTRQPASPLARCPSSQSVPLHPVARALACSPVPDANLAYPCPPFLRFGYPRAIWRPPVLPDLARCVLRRTGLVRR